MIGTFINITAVLIGGGLGCILGNRLPERTRETVMSGLGLVTMVVGMSMALKTANVIIVLGSVLAGGVVGEWLKIESRLNAIGRRLEARFGGEKDSEDNDAALLFVRGFVTASLVFCIGPLAILGAINDGLVGDFTLLAIKSVLDGFAALAFAATMGVGVLFSALSLLVYQGGISLTAMLLGAQVGELNAQHPAIVEMSATGGVLIMGIGLILLELREVRVGNFLPAIFIAPIVVVALRALGVLG